MESVNFLLIITLKITSRSNSVYEKPNKMNSPIIKQQIYIIVITNLLITLHRFYFVNG